MEVTNESEGWIKKHPLAALFWGILGPTGAWIFKDVIKKVIEEGIKPLLTQMSIWILIHLGAYNALLNKYRQTLQRKLKAVGLTQQLLGEGVDLEQNYIRIQLSKEEYKHPETIPSIDPIRESQQEIKVHHSTEEPKRERIEVREALTDENKYGNRIAIIGDPGAGKTTLLQYLAYQCTKGEGVKPIPALITLTACVKSEAKSLLSYLEVLFEESAFPKAKDFLEGQLKAGKFLILLDGFDEVEIDKRGELKRQIEAFANNEEYLQNKFVITSRPIRDAVFDNFRHLEAMPLTLEQRKAFLESKIDDTPDSAFNADRCAQLVKAIEEHDRIRKLAENPLLLTFLYHVYKYNLELPRRRVELYRLSVDLMLDWDIKTGRPTHIKVGERDAKREVLKKVAYYYHTRAVRELSETELFAQVKTHLPDALKGKFTPKELIGEIENSSGILRHRTAENYEFIHLTFQEYLTADYINDNRNKEIPKLMRRLNNPWWKEVTLLLAGIMGNATSLVSQILDYGQQVTEEPEIACLFMAFNSQAIEVIGNTVGLIEAENEELEKLFVNILNSLYEPVQAWGVGFLNQYPQLAKESEHLIEDIQKIFYQALQKFPTPLQVRIIKEALPLIEKVLSLKQIAEAIWNTFTIDPQVNSFDYLNQLYALCNQTTIELETHKNLLLSQSAQLIRFLIGGLTLQSTNSLDRLKQNSLSFTPCKKTLIVPTFTDDFVRIWQDTIEIYQVLALNLKWNQESDNALIDALNWVLTDAQFETTTWVHIRTLARALFLVQAQELNNLNLTQVLDEAQALVRALTLARVKDQILFLNLDQAQVQARNLVQTLARDLFPVQGLELNPSLIQARDQARDRALILAQAEIHAMGLKVLDQKALNLGWDLALVQSLDPDRARDLNSKVLLILARDLALAVALVRAQTEVRDCSQSALFIHDFLRTAASQNLESPWYIFTILQQIHAAAFLKPNSELLTNFQQQWEQRSDNPDILPYQSAFFVNLATLLHTFGISSNDTFFENVLKESARPEMGFVLQVSYLLYRIVVDQATEAEQQEFWKLLQTGGSPLEREWLEFSGLTLLREK
ncbi:NACHT domain-containing protein [Candidatus Poribacteria bacterium]|nr:NACHT domain-containing protein [Candidatus Poribacteria bacterium]